MLKSGEGRYTGPALLLLSGLIVLLISACQIDLPERELGLLELCRWPVLSVPPPGGSTTTVKNQNNSDGSATRTETTKNDDGQVIRTVVTTTSTDSVSIVEKSGTGSAPLKMSRTAKAKREADRSVTCSDTSYHARGSRSTLVKKNSRGVMISGTLTDRNTKDEISSRTETSYTNGLLVKMTVLRNNADGSSITVTGTRNSDGSFKVLEVEQDSAGSETRRTEKTLKPPPGGRPVL